MDEMDDVREKLNIEIYQLRTEKFNLSQKTKLQKERLDKLQKERERLEKEMESSKTSQTRSRSITLSAKNEETERIIRKPPLMRSRSKESNTFKNLDTFWEDEVIYQSKVVFHLDGYDEDRTIILYGSNILEVYEPKFIMPPLLTINLNNVISVSSNSGIITIKDETQIIQFSCSEKKLNKWKKYLSDKLRKSQ